MWRTRCGCDDRYRTLHPALPPRALPKEVFLKIQACCEYPHGPAPHRYWDTRRKRLWAPRRLHAELREGAGSQNRAACGIPPAWFALTLAARVAPRPRLSAKWTLDSKSSGFAASAWLAPQAAKPAQIPRANPSWRTSSRACPPPIPFPWLRRATQWKTVGLRTGNGSSTRR